MVTLHISIPWFGYSTTHYVNFAAGGQTGNFMWAYSVMGRMTLTFLLNLRVDLGRLITGSLFRRKIAWAVKSKSSKEP
jgi:hypothetical protein